MSITFVRHGEVIEEYLGKYNGHIDIPLSKNGHKQAEKLANELKNQNFDAVYSSDLIRAKETLDAFNLDIKPIFTKRLREKSWGIHEGKSFTEIEKSGIKYKNFNQWINALDGEDINIYTKNVKNFFTEELLQNTAKNILVITHSGFIKTIISIITHSSLEEAFYTKIEYASYFTISEEKYRVINSDF